jgi:two-component system, OmpR family, sensor kinase
MKALATRLSLRFAGVFAMLLFGVVAFTSLIIVADANKTAQQRMASAEADVAQLSRLYAATGRSLAAAAPGIVQSVSAHQVRIAVFDESGKLLEGDGSLTTQPKPRYFDRIEVPGGSVAVAPAGDVGQGLLGYWILMVFLGGIGLIVAWFVGRHLASQSLRPVADVTGALTKLADGDFSRRTFVMEERSEVGSLTHAFNAAVDKVSSVFSQRDATEARMRQFIADAGHELRTPLTVMMGYVDVLRRGAVREEQLALKVLETMSDEGGRMRSLIDKLLTLARMEDVAPPDNRPIDLANLISDVVDSLRKATPDRVITWTAAPGIHILGDESEFRAALVNLVDNAIKYAPDSPVDVSARSADSTVDVTVSDTGPGMSAQERAQAFDRFYRGENRGDETGAGLGLAIVKRTVERAGGSVDLESAPNAGTRVTIRMPAID